MRGMKRVIHYCAGYHYACKESVFLHCNVGFVCVHGSLRVSCVRAWVCICSDVWVCTRVYMGSRSYMLKLMSTWRQACVNAKVPLGTCLRTYLCVRERYTKGPCRHLRLCLRTLACVCARGGRQSQEMNIQRTVYPCCWSIVLADSANNN